MSQNKLIIGSHVNFNKNDQLVGATKTAISYGANTFMFYTGAPQNTARSEIDDFKTLEALELIKKEEIDFSKVIVHAPYIINLANRKNLDFGISFLTEEIERCEQLGVKYLVLHPGSHVGAGIDVGIQNVIDGLNLTFMSNHSNVQVLLETMSGKGSEIGSNFLELKRIIDGVKYNNRLGVCIDTCHLNDAGYNIDKFDDVLKEFDEIIGLDKLKCIHINDSKNDISSHKDRHENIGFGTISFKTLLDIIYHPKLTDIPKILETPYIDGKYPPYRFEIESIKNKQFNENLKEDITNYYNQDL